MTKSNAENVAAHRARLADRGLTRVEVTIPVHRREELKRLEKLWRAEAQKPS